MRTFTITNYKDEVIEVRHLAEVQDLKEYLKKRYTEVMQALDKIDPEMLVTSTHHSDCIGAKLYTIDDLKKVVPILQVIDVQENMTVMGAGLNTMVIEAGCCIAKQEGYPTYSNY